MERVTLRLLACVRVGGVRVHVHVQCEIRQVVEKVEEAQLQKLLSPKCYRERAAGTFHFNNSKVPD